MSTLKSKLEALGATSETLDSIVDDGASRLASRINNEGMSDQIEFLENKVGLSEDEILTAVQAEL